MAGLYFHIPFCKRICAYCDFFRSADLRCMPQTIEAMHRELDEAHRFISDRKLRTIYFGGGTPSLLHPSEFQRFIDQAAGLFDCSSVEEITIEANPDDITSEFVSELRLTSVNRVSLGVQSFDDEELKFMNRRHSAEEAVRAVRRLQDSGVENITIDLIFGVDGFDENVLRSSVERAIELDVQHISAYHLTIEPSTTFHRRLTRGQMREIDERQSELEYLLVEKMLCEAGYEHYEVSNYARAGFRSKHNSSYWQGVQYLGIGPGAHSFNGEERRWCSQSIAEYIASRRYEGERLSEQDHFNEYVMTSLRRAEGIDLDFVASRFGDGKCAKLIAHAERWREQGDLVLNDRRLYIPTSKFLISDSIIECLFEV